MYDNTANTAEDDEMTISTLLTYCYNALDQIQLQIHKVNNTFFGEQQTKEYNLEGGISKKNGLDLHKGYKAALVEMAERLAEVKTSLETLNKELV